jgi:sucrose phosphorylase
VLAAGPAGYRPGLLDLAEMAAIFERAAAATGGESAAASRRPAWASVPHQINSTFFSVLGRDHTRYLLARAVQLFAPGRPQIYYVGLLGGTNDMDRFARTGEGRDVNRHHYPAAELAAALASDVTQAQLDLVRLRSTHPAFDGTFALTHLGGARIELVWTNGVDRAALIADLDPIRPAYRIDVT